ncbi:MAG: MaoC/PaaZ C-terminal domain-containing protein [Anaerolineae bacterium]|nr:MaoC/PaaZ C-terminal domain-containing protein [Anaerolineae bacterium]MDW8098941.1 MaoC/PaaZ C-terminal domain-containing protein [Anaerolineae bacterium]
MEDTPRLAPRRGLYFEEFSVGDEVTSAGRTITEADIVAFAALTGDWNRIHTDAEYARTTQFGERIAHGLLGLSVASGLAVRLGFMEDTVIAFMEIGEWQFRAPIRIGDTIRLRATVQETRPMRRLGGGYVTFKVAILNQRDETVQRGTWTILVKFKPQSDPV